MRKRASASQGRLRNYSFLVVVRAEAPVSPEFIKEAINDAADVITELIITTIDVESLGQVNLIGNKGKK